MKENLKSSAMFKMRINVKITSSYEVKKTFGAKR